MGDLEACLLFQNPSSHICRPGTPKFVRFGREPPTGTLSVRFAPVPSTARTTLTVDHTNPPQQLPTSSFLFEDTITLQRRGTMAYHVAKLLTMTETELDDLFTSVEAGPVPNGEAKGTAI